MSAVEQKIPGHYTRGMDCTVPGLHDVDAAGCTDEWGTPEVPQRTGRIAECRGCE